MKGDMAGAAAVLFAMRALGKIRPDVKVVGILCCAENMPDANAQRPGDIFTAKNGKSVMVDNTDAEGRLVLIDGLDPRRRGGGDPRRRHRDPHRAPWCVRSARASPASWAPTATSSAASCARARTTASRSGSCRSSRSTASRCKTPFADINNIAAGGLAGAITAGLFLREFVPDGRRVGPPRHRRADVPGQGVEVLRGGGHRLRREDAGRPVRALP